MGDRVLVPFNIFCGTCFFCQKELYGNCHNTNPEATAVGGIYGYSHTTGGYDGGQAEYVRVPMADVGPDGDSRRTSTLDDAVLLTDAFPTGYQAAEMGDIERGRHGGRVRRRPGRHLRRQVGLAAGRRPRDRGRPRRVPARVRASSSRSARSSTSRRCDDMADPPQEDDRLAGRRRLHRLRGLRGRRAASLQHADRRASCKLQAGAATVLHWAINSVRKGGTVSIVGVYGPTFNAVPIGNAVNKGLTLRMNQASVKRHLPRLIEHIQAGRIKPQRDHHAPHPARGGRRRVPHLLEQARQLHQDGADPPSSAANRSMPWTPRSRFVMNSQTYTEARTRRAQARPDRYAAHPGLGRRPRPRQPPGLPEGAHAAAPGRRALGRAGAAAAHASRCCIRPSARAAARCSAPTVPPWG